VSVSATIRTTNMERQTTVTRTAAATKARRVEVTKHSASTQVYLPVYFIFYIHIQRQFAIHTTIVASDQDIATNCANIGFDLRYTWTCGLFVLYDTIR